MKIAVIGSLNMDLVVNAERIPSKGETIRGSDIRYSPGGKGANQAVAIAKLGGVVEMFGCVGSDANGKQLVSNLTDYGVGVNDIKVTEHAPTGTAFITVGQQDNTIVIVSGANECVDETYINSIKDKLLCADLVVLQHEIPQAANEYIIRLCKKHGKQIMLNPAPARDIDKELIEDITYLTPNEHEAAIIFKSGNFEDWLKQYPEKLIITQGSEGVSFGNMKREIVKIPARKVDVVDTTGAGDTLNGAFAFQIAKGVPLEDALRFANDAAALSIGKLGAQNGIPTLEQVQALRY